MTVHLIKLSVGIENIEHLSQVQRARLKEMRIKAKEPQLRHLTRHTPRRQKEILDGGSIYWVIKGVIQVRQKITGFEATKRQNGDPACAILYETEHIRTEPKSYRAFQGWRYLPTEKAPPDLAKTSHYDTDLPTEMAAELRDLGLL